MANSFTPACMARIPRQLEPLIHAPIREHTDASFKGGEQATDNRLEFIGKKSFPQATQ